MSNLYAGHFRLIADRLNNPAKAYQIVERARGRALADVLRAPRSLCHRSASLRLQSGRIGCGAWAFILRRVLVDVLIP